MLQNLTDRIKETLQNLAAQLQESPAYNSLKEKFDSLTPQMQKLIASGSIGAFLLMLFMLPYGYYSSSKSFDDEFNNKRQLLRELLRASRVNTVDASIRNFDRNEIENQVHQMLSGFTLLPDQFEGIIDLAENDIGPSLAPAEIKSLNVGAQFKKLNLKQMQEIGYRLQNIDSSIKLIGMDLQADTENDHYFNVLYKLSSFSLSESNPANTFDKSPSNQNKKSFNKKNLNTKRKKSNEGDE